MLKQVLLKEWLEKLRSALFWLSRLSLKVLIASLSVTELIDQTKRRTDH